MIIREVLYKIYWKIENIIVPTLKYSQSIYEDTISLYVNPNLRWLDLGCGHKILPEWRLKEEKDLVSKCKMIVGIDYDLHSLKNHKNIHFKVRGDISKLPFSAASFDLVTANLVVEHLENPEVHFKEVNRILKSNGIFIFHTPNLLCCSLTIGRLAPQKLKEKIIYILDNRGKGDVFDTYYGANTRGRIKILAQNTGFNILKTKMIVSTALFKIVPPLALFELIWIKILMTKLLKGFRPNIIAILKKQYNMQPDHLNISNQIANLKNKFYVY